MNGCACPLALPALSIRVKLRWPLGLTPGPSSPLPTLHKVCGVLAVFDPVGTAYQGTIEGEHPLLLSPVPRGLEKGNRQTKKKSPHAGVEVPEGLFKSNFGDR